MKKSELRQLIREEILNEGYEEELLRVISKTVASQGFTPKIAPSESTVFASYVIGNKMLVVSFEVDESSPPSLRISA